MLKNSLKKYIKFLPALIYSAFILYVSSRPWPKAPKIPHLDKLAHLIIYGVLTILILFAFKNKKCLLAVFIAGIYGIINEIVQLFVPGRSCSFADMFFNFLGAFLFVFIYIKIINNPQKKEN